MLKTVFVKRRIIKYKNVEKKMLFAKLFGPTEKLLLKEYHTWQCGEHLTET